jgi:hypothetical protein
LYCAFQIIYCCQYVKYLEKTSYTLAVKRREMTVMILVTYSSWNCLSIEHLLQNRGPSKLPSQYKSCLPRPSLPAKLGWTPVHTSPLANSLGRTPIKAISLLPSVVRHPHPPPTGHCILFSVVFAPSTSSQHGGVGSYLSSLYSQLTLYCRC